MKNGIRCYWWPVVSILLAAICIYMVFHKRSRQPVEGDKILYRQDYPAPMAHWPWPHVQVDTPHPGVTHYIDRSSTDKTVVELLDFDFQKNPHLRLELYDQDEDDDVPFDNCAEVDSRGVGWATHHLNEIGRGKVVAAWNGVFFNAERTNAARHVAPVVLNGKAFYNVGLVRWAFGVKYTNNKPNFKVLRLPSFKTLESQYDFAAESACCLINNGHALHLRPFPKAGEDRCPPSTPPGPDDSGFVRKVDHLRTSRTSMAWSKDNRHLYLLVVKEPDSEGMSYQAFNYGLKSTGGFTVADEQRFWQQFGAWGAVNLDGGDITQMTILLCDGNYDLVPARCSPSMRLALSSNCENAPGEGSIMYFFVRDTTNK